MYCFWTLVSVLSCCSTSRSSCAGRGLTLPSESVDGPMACKHASTRSTQNAAKWAACFALIHMLIDLLQMGHPDLLPDDRNPPPLLGPLPLVGVLPDCFRHFACTKWKQLGLISAIAIGDSPVVVSNSCPSHNGHSLQNVRSTRIGFFIFFAVILPKKPGFSAGLDRCLKTVCCCCCFDEEVADLLLLLLLFLANIILGRKDDVGAGGGWISRRLVG
mmetsp:Transcript_13986/g.39814  ORF Transcript_13986/g.39814 Transcript_13986/m.39814 type:complete len:217 (-) Transcript_13986:973-1623(-)